jgi:hypothetical protein
MSTCSQCGAALDAAETYFDLNGAICCKKCEQAHDIGQLSAKDDAAMEALSKKHDRSSMTLKIVGAIVLVAAIVGGVVFMKQGASGAAECAPCKADSDCAAGFKCMEFGAKIESKTKLCGTQQSTKCKP